MNMYQRFGAFLALLIFLTASAAAMGDPPRPTASTDAAVATDDSPNTNAFIKPQIDGSSIVERPVEDSAGHAANLPPHKADRDKASASRSPLTGLSAGVRRAILRVYRI